LIHIQGRPLIRVGVDIDIPLVGSVAFGIIDRGTNLIQVRPNSYCVLSCIFCSTDAGPCSRWRASEYYVSSDVITEWFKYIARFKNTLLEAHIDTVGDPLLYDKLPDIIHELKNIPNVKTVSIQTHAATLTKSLADKLWAAGLDRINLSIDTTDPLMGRYIQSTEWYDVRKVMELAEYILSNTTMDILLAPVLLPGINDYEIPKIIEWGLRIGVGRRYPPFGIQKFLKHKHGRVPKGLRNLSWSEFYRYLRTLEMRYHVKLTLSTEDFGITEVEELPKPFKVGDSVKVRTVALGWLKNEVLAVPVHSKFERVITVIGRDIPLDTKLTVRIIRNKHNIYIARPT